ncbi:hypothetical protein CAEBREN_01742 [Caenorhabditis brenneri]|uniref:Uncharacterized protein n=1 Tax=Caenorhabditis brenneri TaxID=135651 RepID=G0MWV9_CAEBE|nr:hypothetical protein CAEBREN_01742 [Caenorhabditis brenneri]
MTNFIIKYLNRQLTHLKNEVAGQSLVFAIPLCHLYLILILISNFQNKFYLISFIIHDKLLYTLVNLVLWVIAKIWVVEYCRDKPLKEVFYQNLMTGLGGIAVYSVKMKASFDYAGENSLLFNYDLFICNIATLFFFYAFINGRMIYLPRFCFWPFVLLFLFVFMILGEFLRFFVSSGPFHWANEILFLFYFLMCYLLLIADLVVLWVDKLSSFPGRDAEGKRTHLNCLLQLHFYGFFHASCLPLSRNPCCAFKIQILFFGPILLAIPFIYVYSIHEHMHLVKRSNYKILNFIIMAIFYLLAVVATLTPYAYQSWLRDTQMFVHIVNFTLPMWFSHYFGPIVVDFVIWVIEWKKGGGRRW